MTEDPDSADIDVDNRNIASDNAHVDQQIGVQFADSVFHDANIYTVSEDDTAERKHEVALAYLAGGVPRHAQSLFGTLVFTGHQTTERAYYYVLSVLSDRGFGDLTADLVTGIRDAGKISASLAEDEWAKAHDVVRSLLAHVQSTDIDISFLAVTAFGELPAERQDEISRHLSLLVGGVVEQQLDAERKHKVEAERFSGSRVDRAWKFFEPEPAVPTRYQPRTFPPELGERRPALTGGLVAVLASAGLVFGPMTFAFWSGLSLFVAGFAIVARYGVEHAAHLVHVERDRDVEEPDDEQDGRTPIDKLVDRCFRDARPEGAADWTQYTAAHRARLRRRFDIQFGYSTRPVRQLKWLADWHARWAAEQWQHDDEHGRSEPAVPQGVRLWLAFGALLTMAGLVLLLLAAQRWQVVPLVAGGWFAVPAMVEVFAIRRATRFQVEEADALVEDELAEYRRWKKELADRPDDREMARWLALDKAHLKAEALRRGNIAEKDLVTHVVLNELAPWARRGIVLHGPPRYTAYLITVILLTRYGVRASRVYLDFITGEVKNENWYVFGYDRIASASLSVRERTTSRGSDEPERKMRNREFRLRLLDGSEIIKINERLDDNDAEVDEAELEGLTAATSGMDAALPVLEAVAHQGRDWIALESDRRKLWSRGWSD
jgi:hypothetical protein